MEIALHFALIAAFGEDYYPTHGTQRQGAIRTQPVGPMMQGQRRHVDEVNVPLSFDVGATAVLVIGRRVGMAAKPYVYGTGMVSYAVAAV